MFGDVDNATLECLFDDPSVYDAVVVRAIEPGTGLLAGAARGTREAAQARYNAMRNAEPVGYRPDILAAVQAALGNDAAVN